MEVFDKDTEAFGANKEGLLDMRFGDPAFLQPYWRGFKPEVISGSGLDMGYVNSYGSESLKQAIRDIHNKVGNAVADDKHIVLGVGASQMLAAAVYALKNKDVWAKPPFFSRFLQLTKFAGIDANLVVSDLPPIPGELTQIITCPNNPDGKHESFSYTEDSIYDLVYNWPQYTDVIKYDEDLMVFGLAKATGHASTRVGWALVKDKNIAEAMHHYIEMSTCGVGVESLKMTERILRQQIIIEDKYLCFKHGKDKLRRRRDKLNEALKDKEFEILNDSGMFVWGRVKDKNACKIWKDKYGVLAVNGRYFGMPDDSYFRLNLGCDVNTFTSLIEKLSV